MYAVIPLLLNTWNPWDGHPFFPMQTLTCSCSLTCAHMEIFRARAVRYNEHVNTMVIKQNKSVQGDGKSFTNQ